MKKNEDRCDHCGRFVPLGQLFTLHDEAHRHEHEEDVAICERCGKQYQADYWSRWLDQRFPKSEQVEKG